MGGPDGVPRLQGKTQGRLKYTREEQRRRAWFGEEVWLVVGYGGGRMVL